MGVQISHKELHERCQVRVPRESHFTIYNLPLGIFQTSDRAPGVGMAIGNYIIDLRVLAESGLFHGVTSKIHFEQQSLNSLMSQGRQVNDQLREKVQALLTGDSPGFSVLKKEALVEQRIATMLMPIEVGDYTDFYSSEEHATNVGQLFRSKEEALLPNWKHMPIGYHGRASSIITSGVDVKRPSGQIKLPDSDSPIFSASRKLDFELELAFVIGKNSSMGESVSTGKAEDYIFGFALMNDWSARDIQQWEYRPLGPFLGKSFATSISPWIVSLTALESYKVEGPDQDPEVLPYLKATHASNFDINLEVELKTDDGYAKKITSTNSKLLYWSAAQQLAHQTVNGCNLRVGDLLASGTISGKKKEEWGSMLEQTFNGTEALSIHPGVERKFIEDGDQIIMTGWAGEGNFKVGFGELKTGYYPQQNKMFNLKQDYDSYTEEDFQVWKLMYDRQVVNFPGRAADAFMDAMRKVNFIRSAIPNFDYTNQILKSETGWSLEVVPGLIPDKDFFELFSRKRFPATTWLRKMSELDYLEEPDMFHDVFAHVPLLSNQFFVDYLQALSVIALKHIDNPFAIEMIGRVYWFTVEFGLIKETDGLRIYGAGILSSAGETIFCLEDEAVRYDYDVRAIMENHYFKHAFQDRYYVIESFEQLFGSVKDIEKWVDVAVDRYPTITEDVSKLDVVLS